jgi:TolA-binding protein
MKTIRSCSLALATVMFLLAGCQQTATSAAPTSRPAATAAQTSVSAPAMTSTPDPCAKANLPPEIQKVDELTRQFDDASAIVSNMLSSITVDQLGSDIATLQQMRRAAEDETVPSCLTNLKDLQLAHMNTVIDTLLLILGKGDKNVITQGVAQANQLSQQYIIEKARLLGILTIIPETPTATAGTPGPGTKTAPTATPTH